jgi:hypothetical protein
MSVRTESESVAAPVPEPEFEIATAAYLAFAAAPTMVFQALATESGGHDIQSLALSVQVMIEPAKRGYDPETRAKLAELFGPPARWAASTQALQWAQLSVVVPAFRESAAFAIEVPCTYDLEVATVKYFYALDAGDVPLAFHFSGQVFYRGADGRLQVTFVPWSRSTHFRMPIEAWKAMIAEHYPGVGWARLSEDTLRVLSDRRAARGLPTFDAAVRELLDA